MNSNQIWLRNVQVRLLRYCSIRRRLRVVYVVLLSLFISLSYFSVRSYSIAVSEAELKHYRLQRYLNYQTRPVGEGPGENGVPVTLSPDEQKVADSKWKNASFNVVASDKIALDRTVPDTRRKE